MQPTPSQTSQNWFERHKKALIFGGVAALLLGVGSFLAFKFLLKPKTQATVIQKKTVAAKPTTVASPLTGLQVSKEVADQPIVASIIENHPDARPQSGLSSAGVVYEALAEGGITRFLAFFLDTKPALVGPVRSIRSYFVDWTLEFNAPIMHVGGNIEGLDLIGPLHVKDLNQFYNGSYFFRSKDRYAPHNVYITNDKITALLKAKGWNGKSTFTPNKRQKDAPLSTPDHPNIHINYSYNGFQVDYKYDTATNSYARFLAGAPHIDRNTGKQIYVKNIVVQYMPTTYGTTRIGEKATRMATPGSGKAIVFRDGTAIVGTWSKTNHTTRTKLTDAQGNEIALNAGNTWFSIVPVGNTVTY